MESDKKGLNIIQKGWLSARGATSWWTKIQKLPKCKYWGSFGKEEGEYNNEIRQTSSMKKNDFQNLSKILRKKSGKKKGFYSQIFNSGSPIFSHRLKRSLRQ